MSEQFPCYKCPYRKLTCHDYCEEYLKVRDELNAERAKRQVAYDAISLLVEGIMRKNERKHKR